MSLINTMLRRERTQGVLLTSTQTLVGTDPAAGAEVSQVVPAGQLWQLLAVSVQLVQGITDTPQPMLVIDDGTNVVWEMFGATAAQAVSTTCRYNWAPGAPLTGLIGAGVNVHASAPMPSLMLPAGYRVRTSTIGLTATGNYGAPTLLYVQY